MKTRPHCTPWHSPARLALWVALPMAHTSEVEKRLIMILDITRSRRQTTRRILFAALGLGATALLPLAALRPAAKAQSRNTGPATKTAQATSGALVTLVGLTEGQTAESRWWNQAGTYLPQPVFDTSTYHDVEMYPQPDKKTVYAVFRLPATLEAATVKYDLPQSSGFGSAGQWPGKMSGQENETEAQLDARTGGMRIVASSYPRSLAKTNVRVGVATDPWTTVAADPSAAHENGGGPSSMSEQGRTVIFSPVAETKDGLVLTVTTEGIKDDVRVVAVDKTDHELLPALIGDTSGASVSQITGRFAVPMTQLKEFCVQTRPFVWTEFKDVALRPFGAAVASAGGPEEAVKHLQQIYAELAVYRRAHGGALPATSDVNKSLWADIANHPQAYGLPDQGAGNSAQAIRLFTGPSGNPLRYYLPKKRPDGALVGSAKRAGARDVLAYTDLYVSNLYAHNLLRGVAGFYLVLWDDGTVGKIPANQAVTVPAYDGFGSAAATEEAARQGKKQIAFAGQAGFSKS